MCYWCLLSLNIVKITAKFRWYFTLGFEPRHEPAECWQGGAGRRGPAQQSISRDLAATTPTTPDTTNQQQQCNHPVILSWKHFFNALKTFIFYSTLQFDTLSSILYRCSQDNWENHIYLYLKAECHWIWRISIILGTVCACADCAVVHRRH